jgi:hypothetical protein
MFEFLGFGRARKAKEDEKQSEVIRLALNSVLRRRGIAPQSIGCELTPMSRRGAGDVMLVQLQILGWNEKLLHDASDLENELFDVISLYGRGSRAADFLFVWKFALESGKAASKLPEPEAKVAPPEAKLAEPGLAPAPTMALPIAAASVVAAAAVAAPAVKFDLPKSARDQIDDQNDYGFPPTVMVDNND